MKYSYAHGVRTHANKYSDRRGFKKTINYDRLSLIVAGALLLALLGYAFVIRQSINFPSPVSAFNGAIGQENNMDDDNSDKPADNNQNTAQSGQNGNNLQTDPATGQPTIAGGAGTSSPAQVGSSQSSPATGDQGERIIGGRGGGVPDSGSTTPTAPSIPETPTTPTIPSVPPAPEPECICETVNDTVNQLQSTLPSVTVPLLSTLSFSWTWLSGPIRRRIKN